VVVDKKVQVQDQVDAVGVGVVVVVVVGGGTSSWETEGADTLLLYWERLLAHLRGVSR